MSSKFRFGALTAAAAVAVCLPITSAGAQTTYPVNTNVLTAYLTGLGAPNTPAPGANVACHVTPAHPQPVLLVHGTFENQNDNFQALAPTLANAGYCVYSFNYSASSSGIDGTGEIAASAKQLATAVAQVRQITGAKKIDIVGHSQGGMMPNYYLKFLNGAGNVAQFVGISPSNHGTTLDGLTVLGSALGLLTGVNSILGGPCEACIEQEVGSTFLTHLNAKGDTVPGPHYTVIETTHDEVVTPYASAFLQGPNVTNINLQTLCPNDGVGHVGMTYDTTTLQLVLNALDPATATTPTCTSGFGL